MTEKKKLTPLSEIGEFGLIKHINSQVSIKNNETIKGIGDDAAVLAFGNKQGDVETPFAGFHKVVVMVLERKIANQVVKKTIQFSMGHFSRILKFQASCGSVARVCKQGLPINFPLTVQVLKRTGWHEDFASDLEFIREVAFQSQRD